MESSLTLVSVIDTLIVILFGLIGALLSEWCGWFLVYRTESYQSLLEDVNRATRKLDKQKETVAKSVKMSAKLKAQEEQVAKKNQNLSYMRMKAQLVSSVIYFLIIPIFNRVYSETVVATLPFEPKLFFRALAHRGLTTFKETDCSAMYLYILSIGFCRTNLQKLIGATPVKSSSSTQAAAFGSFFQPTEQS